MAGHSKWANTKYRKFMQDTKRGKIFNKIIREIVTAVKLGGNNPTINSRLRTAIDKALLNNMTRSTLNRTIARSIGNNENNHMKDIIYEGYALGGVAVMVKCLSDNHNRTVSEVRHAFTKTGGNLSANGSVAYLFSKKGVISYASDKNKIMIIDLVIQAGANDIIVYDDGTIDVLTTPEDFNSVKDILETSGLKARMAEISFISSVKVDLDTHTMSILLHLIDILEELDDVQEVYHNGKISNKITATL
ncbi:YebC/PmpR family DNA-binding transcriptional regulator [Candidatus Fukatsuia anoeciicola]|uniref:YebC/PmpR family DNA-binding transcriptional regulator n=1 Tax=Candidatus Fukatsuia anoeciicola TaxID=2994492 RepID=UPI003463FB9A